MGKIWKFRLYALCLFAAFYGAFNIFLSHFQPDRNRLYPVYFTNIGTLENDDPVKQAGRDVGKVTGISVKEIQEPTNTRYIVVDIDVNEQARIALDSTATIQTMGMMGEKYLDISFGQMDEAPEGTRIEGQGPQQLQANSDMQVSDEVLKAVAAQMSAPMGAK